MILLASNSSSRQQLLTWAQIPYKVVSHNSTEKGFDNLTDLDERLLAISLDKMAKISIPSHFLADASYLYCITADTLVQNIATGEILEKPSSYSDAVRMVKSYSQKLLKVASSTVIEKKAIKEGRTITLQTKQWVSSAIIEFSVPDDMVDIYLAHNDNAALYSSGALIVEEFGFNFLRTVNGSFTSILGFDVPTLRSELKELGFF
ncbi:hypothetical protein GEMRC1_008989 [Eukaryota sp. GEM-RC1]